MSRKINPFWDRVIAYAEKITETEKSYYMIGEKNKFLQYEEELEVLKDAEVIIPKLHIENDMLLRRIREFEKELDGRDK